MCNMGAIPPAGGPIIAATAGATGAPQPTTSTSVQAPAGGDSKTVGTSAPTKDAVAGAAGGAPPVAAIDGVAQLPGLEGILQKLTELLATLKALLGGKPTPPPGGGATLDPHHGMPDCPKNTVSIRGSETGIRWGG